MASPAGMLSNLTTDRNGNVSKVALYAAASVLSFIVYAYLVNKYVSEDSRSEYVKNQLMSGTAGYGTARAFDAASRYLFNV
jgi:hypothetical protein